MCCGHLFFGPIDEDVKNIVCNSLYSHLNLVHQCVENIDLFFHTEWHCFMVNTQASACCLSPSLIFRNDQLSYTKPHNGVS